MKTFILASIALLLFTGVAYASKEHCVSRTVQTNYNDGLNGAITKVCFASENGFKEPSPKKECHDESK